MSLHEGIAFDGSYKENIMWVYWSNEKAKRTSVLKTSKKGIKVVTLKKVQATMV